jgi:hypothetical protein
MVDLMDTRENLGYHDENWQSRMDFEVNCGNTAGSDVILVVEGCREGFGCFASLATTPTPQSISLQSSAVQSCSLHTVYTSRPLYRFQIFPFSIDSRPGSLE